MFSRRGLLETLTMKKMPNPLAERLTELLADRYHGQCLKLSAERILATGPEDEFEEECLRKARSGELFAGYDHG